MRRKTIIACCIGIGLYIGCSLWPHHSEFDDKGTLEDAMGMEIPNYKVKEYISDPIIDCHGDFSDKIVIEFEEIPSKQFIDSVNQRVVADTLRNDNRWLKHGKHQYRFSGLLWRWRKNPKM